VRLLLSETWSSHIYAEPFYQRLKELGVEAHAFKEAPFFRADGVPWPARLPISFLRRAQERYRAGPALNEMNAALIRTAEQIRPDAVFLFRGDNIFPDTVRHLRAVGRHVLGWNNDDPFSARAPRYRWRNFVRAIPLYDRLWAYRHSNAAEFHARGCKRTGVLRSFYLRELNYPIDDTAASPYRAQVSFIGHWEDDGRERFVERLLREPGIDFRLWGTLWERSRLSRRLKRKFGPIQPLLREDYNLAINSADISLVFLSKLNNDTYTRRCFEIPITGTMMLSQYTADLATMFREGEEAEFFRTEDEMVDKIRYYLRHDDARRKLGQAGQRRVLRDGHEALDRARTVLDTLRDDLASLTLGGSPATRC
jgi:spore maturation protein CgeB